ncbi:hypothetical protein L0337_25010 [candidate division KSB1 bacterium]|nr:hypothetical protein [candidate division KSB1 bacterium]
MNPIGEATTRRSAFGQQPRHDLPTAHVIPYDYVADFRLRGEAGNLVQDVINISVDGVFVATALGYGFDEDRAELLTLIPSLDPETNDPKPEIPQTLGEITLENIPPDVLIEGFRINPDFAGVAIQKGVINENLRLDAAPGILQRLNASENFSFMLSIVDTSSGRELQNKPVHSLATLGRADGRRPFKMLPQPMVFMPRSTIRLQVEERTAGASGRLFITLQGYKILGAASKEEAARWLGQLDPQAQIPVYDHETGNYRRLGEAMRHDVPTSRLIPFDYVSTLDLTGKRGNVVEDEVPINVDGGYVTTAIGYGLDAPDTSVQTPDEEDLPLTELKLIDLKPIKLRELKPAQALLDGIRIHPLRVRFAFTREGRLSELPFDLLSRMFQRLNRPEEVRFLYSFSDSGTGRDLQNQPVHNVAGLGIANGERPFKVLHRPIMFLPRSTIRVQVHEIFGRGRLFIVFQGYKILR